MLTEDQEKWINHLSNTNKTTIAPYNPKSKSLFQKQKLELQKILGKDVSIVHRGASSLGISGKGELDIYIPVPVERFNPLLKKLIQAYGQPGSHYPFQRARFNRKVDGVLAEIFLINEEAEGWKQGVAFENYLKTHSEELKKYEKLKEQLQGLSTREYYRRKIEFFNEILEKTSI